MNELPTFDDFRAVMREWPSRSALAGDLGLPHWNVEAWWRKNSIPPRWFDPVTRAAIKRDLQGINNDVLLRLHVKRMDESTPKKTNAVGQGADA